MKKIIRFIAVLCLILLAATGCAPKAEPHLVGGYTADRKPDADDLAVFEEVMAGLVGVQYEPTLVATQVVAGLNYRFTATATPVVPDAEPYTVYIIIYKPLSGPPELTEIVDAR